MSAPVPRRSGEDYRCTACRHRLAKSSMFEGLVLSGLKCIILADGNITGKCAKCGFQHALGGLFLPYTGAPRGD